MPGDDDIKPIEVEWSTIESTSGFTAQEIDQFSIDLSDASTLQTITLTSANISTMSGSNGTWATASSGISFVDPYEALETRLAKLEATIAEEKQIRDNHPAVKNAYDEYRLLLVLAKSHLTDE